MYNKQPGRKSSQERNQTNTYMKTSTQIHIKIYKKDNFKKTYQNNTQEPF